MMYSVIINGKEENIENNNLLELLNFKKINAEHIVTEVNGKIIKKDQYEKLGLNNGDKIELIRFMGGG